jgi:hypothetical protein
MSSNDIERTMWACMLAAAEGRPEDVSPLLDALPFRDYGTLVHALAALAARATLPDLVRNSPMADEMAANEARAVLRDLAAEDGNARG